MHTHVSVCKWERVEKKRVVVFSTSWFYGRPVTPGMREREREGGERVRRRGGGKGVGGGWRRMREGARELQ